jgi:hypothetical protein
MSGVCRQHSRTSTQRRAATISFSVYGRRAGRRTRLKAGSPGPRGLGWCLACMVGAAKAPNSITKKASNRYTFSATFCNRRALPPRSPPLGGASFSSTPVGLHRSPRCRATPNASRCLIRSRPTLDEPSGLLSVVFLAVRHAARIKRLRSLRVCLLVWLVHRLQAGLPRCLRPLAIRAVLWFNRKVTRLVISTFYRLKFSIRKALLISTCFSQFCSALRLRFLARTA